ncbi:MAG: hypothetical protein ACRD0G_11680 [Acidimicrobiales bacterium]
MTSPDVSSRRRRVEFEPITDVVACSLGGSDAADRVAEWRELLAAHALGREAVPGGIRFRLASEAAGAAVDLAQREAACCGFLSITVDTGAETVLTVTGDADAAVVIEALLGS